MVLHAMMAMLALKQILANLEVALAPTMLFVQLLTSAIWLVLVIQQLEHVPHQLCQTEKYVKDLSVL